MSYRVTKVLVVACACAIALPRSLHAVDIRTAPCPGKRAQMWYVRDIPAHIPLVAEPHADDLKLTFGRLAQYQYARSTGDRFGADFDVGGELPLLGCVAPKVAGLQTPPKFGEYRFGLYLPVSFHMLWDLEDPSSPIINNDYRFSYGMVKGIVGLKPRPRFPTQLEWRWKLYAHESTHLGDELTIAAQDSVLHGGPVFSRVNVSYEFTEPVIGLMWDDIKEGTLEVRAGATILVNGNSGFYGDSITLTQAKAGDTLLIRTVPVVPSTSRVEPFMQAEFRRHHLLLSADLNNRVVLNYAKSAGMTEERQPSLNVIVGWQSADHTYGDRSRADVFLRYYTGVNPHGQFRDQRHFHLFGLGLHMRT